MSAMVPNTLYNINSYNQVLDINDNGATLAVTLAAGYYTTIHDLATEQHRLPAGTQHSVHRTAQYDLGHRAITITTH